VHLHADHSLFFARPQPKGSAARSLALAVVILVANAGVRNAALSGVAAGVGIALLLLGHARGRRRIEPVVAWTVALVGLALFGGVALGADANRLAATGLRVLCGVVWILWLGTRLDWASLRQLLLGLKLPESVVASIDHALMHGVFTQREWSQRRDAARLRLGSRRLPLSAWGPLLGEGALHAFSRLERAEEAASLRSASRDNSHAAQAVCLEGLVVERGGQRVLEHLDLEVQSGEWLLLCGPSGAGKSSLLRVLAGLDAAAAGSMTRLGKRVAADAALGDRLDGSIALLGQNPEHHFIASTVEEDIVWGLLRRGIESDTARERALETARALGIAQLLARPCHELSFGEQRRAALAGLLVLEPSLLLLDEPTAGLDPVAAHEMRALVEESVSRTGAACVWATHDLHSLPPRATRVALLRDQRVIFDGPTVEGLSQPWLVKAGLAVADPAPVHVRTIERFTKRAENPTRPSHSNAKPG